MATGDKSRTGKETIPTDIAEQMETLRADIGTLTATVAELAQHKGAELSQAAMDQVSAVKKTAGKQADAAKQQALDMQEQANEFARSQPATALGIAAGLGFLIGMLLTRK